MATAPKAPKAAAPTAAYTVLSPLDHDQERYEPGDQVELTETQAAPLLGHTVKPAAVKPAA